MSISEHKVVDFRGKNNPRYGVRTSEKTKEKIGKSTKERFKNYKYRKNHSDSLRKFYKTDMGVVLKDKISNARKRENENF